MRLQGDRRILIDGVRWTDRITAIILRGAVGLALTEAMLVDGMDRTFR
jgi:hypothetical protein